MKKIEVPRKYPEHPQQEFDGKQFLKQYPIDFSFCNSESLQSLGIGEADFGEGSIFERLIGYNEATEKYSGSPEGYRRVKHILPPEESYGFCFFSYALSTRQRNIEELVSLDISLSDLFIKCFRSWVRSEVIATKLYSGKGDYNDFLKENYKLELEHGPKLPDKQSLTFDPGYLWTEYWDMQKSDAYYLFGWRLLFEKVDFKDMINFIEESLSSLELRHLGAVDFNAYPLYLLRTLLRDLTTEQAQDILTGERTSVIRDSEDLAKFYQRIADVSADLAMTETRKVPPTKKDTLGQREEGEIKINWPYVLPVHSPERDFVNPSADYLPFLIDSFKTYLAHLPDIILEKQFVNVAEIFAERDYLEEYIYNLVNLYSIQQNPILYKKIIDQFRALLSLEFKPGDYNKSV